MEKPWSAYCGPMMGNAEQPRQTLDQAGQTVRTYSPNTPTALEEEPASEISTALLHCNQEMEVLRKLTSRLYEKLAPVILEIPRPSAPSNQPDTGKPPMSMMGDALNRLATGLEEASQRLANLIESVRL